MSAHRTVTNRARIMAGAFRKLARRLDATPAKRNLSEDECVFAVCQVILNGELDGMNEAELALVESLGLRALVA
jgi:hypothetical protein